MSGQILENDENLFKEEEDLNNHKSRVKLEFDNKFEPTHFEEMSREKIRVPVWDTDIHPSRLVIVGIISFIL